MDYRTYLRYHPDEKGFFGPYGGAELPDNLKAAFAEITDAYQTICQSAQFINELRRIRKDFQGRPTPVYHCERLSRKVGGAQIYVKREDLNHSGAHKLNHCMGEALLAKYMGKKKVIALDVELNVAQLGRQAFQMGDGSGTTLEFLTDPAQFGDELSGFADGEVGFADFQHCLLQFGGYVASAVLSEEAILIGIVL